MRIRKPLVVAALIVGVAAALALAGTAWSSTPTVKPDTQCSTAGTIGWHDGQKYVCEKKTGDTCLTWHWIYNPGTPKSGRTSWPTCPCNSATPTISPTPTTTASPTASPTPVSLPTTPVATTTAPATPTATTSAAGPTPTGTGSGGTGGGTTPIPSLTPTAGTLPVTGPEVGMIALVGVGLISPGFLILLITRRPEEE